MELQGRNLSINMRPPNGDDVALLHRELGQLIEAGKLDVQIDQSEISREYFGDTTHQAVIAFQEQHNLRATGIVDEPTAEAINAEVDTLSPQSFHIEGKVSSRLSAGVGGLRVEVVDKAVGDDLRLAAAKTDDGGDYRAAFTNADLKPRGKARPDLQTRVYAGRKFLGASDVRYNASNHETLDILLDEEADSALASEYETLTSTLSVHFRGRLRDLKETDDHQDITYLANKTGWDARAVALAALADQFSRRTASEEGGEIEPAVFYGLFRAGLPANESALYQADGKTVERIVEQGLDQGVIPVALRESLPTVIQRFEKLAASRALDGPALVGASSLKEMLAVSLGNDATQQEQFADIHAKHRSDPVKLWKAVEDAFGEAKTKRLRLDGQLGYLTLNNAPLIRKLHEEADQGGINEIIDLVHSDYYHASKWEQRIDDDPVPPEITGENDEEKRGRYAELLASQVRLSFPTAVVAQMVNRGETPLLSAATKEDVHTFLSTHQGKFEIGMQPVEQYIARSKIEVRPEVTEEIKRIQRVYQITPSDEAMNVLLNKGLDSAYAVVRYDQNEFIKSFKNDLGGEASAKLIYAKSQQVHNAVLNIATSFLTASNAPAIGVHSPAGCLDPAPQPPANAADVIAYSTLEELLGEMDYCECKHCRSILSPAAYLTDLLLFLDYSDLAWTNVLVNWKSDHGDAPYPFESLDDWNAAGQPPNTEISPLQVLLSRRPDIQHLPLTCENTNTPLPYIDLVNETLEYFIANAAKPLSLEGYTGHNTTDEATPEELLANPRFVKDAAYTTLAGAYFPLPLPFHQPLENLRRYFDKFEAPLPEVMEALRKDDEVERANANEYGWRDILMEELRLSRSEYALLTDRNLTLQQLYGYAPATPDADVISELSKIKNFTRRIGITYEEMIEILRTCFVNPHSTLIPKIERLGVSFATLKALKDGTISDAEFNAKLSPGVDELLHLYGGDIKTWVKNEENYSKIMKLITVSNPIATDDLCSFDIMEFRYADPDNNANKLDAFEFVRLLRFMRLWKKLGWTIEQTDKAITALYPVNQIPDDSSDTVNLQRLDSGFLVMLPRLGVIKRAIKALKLKPKRDMLSLLACFAPIDTHGAVSLYRQMFGSPALLEQSPAFSDNGYGEFLTDNAQKVMGHDEPLRGAFQLTDDEFAHITTSLGFDVNTPLTVDNISAVFRRGWLARRLKLSVREFLLLVEFAGLDPFAAPEAPNPPILSLIKLVTRLRAASIKPVQALYLIWNQNISGKSAPDDNTITGFARTLRSDLAAVETEFALADDPDGQIAQAKMTQVYGNKATDLFFGLLNNSFVTEVEYSHTHATLEQAILDTAPGRIAYDNFGKRLSFSGVLTMTTRDALKMEVPLAFQNAVDSLYAENRKIIGPFFDRYPELQPLYDAYVASDEALEKKRFDLLTNFLPELKRRRKHQQALQTISAGAGVDATFAGLLLDDKDVLHAASDNARPALDDFTKLEMPGLSALFFYRDTATGAVDLTSDAEADLAYSTAEDPKLPSNGDNPTDAISGIWNGCLEAPETGFYNLRIEADTAAVVELTLSGDVVTLTQNGSVWSNNTPIELRAGTLYDITLQVEEVKDVLNVQWQTTGRGWEVIPSRYLYSATLVNHIHAAYVRLLKATSMATNLRLTANETAYLAAHADYQIGGHAWLNSLPTMDSPDNATSTALLTVFSALLDYARIKAELAPDDEHLLEILGDTPAATQSTDSLLFTLARWNSDSLDALLTRFGKTVADLADLKTFRRVYDSYLLVKKVRVPAVALINAATNEPTADTVRDLQAALRARYDSSNWLDVLKPINDELRSLQRDALVTYILHQMRANPASEHIDTPDKLFEYFLMDVQMDPCMLTSRIRHALSSVQLFIERCLMNLEPRVSPSSINSKHWQWMNRYRVWEANRKVFLWPENWLEPELRDDQSPFFKETMSELLQSDITEDSAATALLNYLSKLEEVAKLEPCGIHYVENDPSKPEGDIAHVVARTAGASRKYFYRRREYGYWTPWEQIKLDIEDNPVIPLVWKERLFLFWLRILKQAPLEVPEIQSEKLANIDPSDIIKTDPPKVTVQAVLCWSEYYNGKWQPTKTSDVNRPTTLGTSDAVGPNAFDRSNVFLLTYEWSEPLVVNVESEALVVNVKSAVGSSSFIMYNAHSLPVREEDGPSPQSPEPMGERFDRCASLDDGMFRFNYGLFDNCEGLPRPILTRMDSMPVDVIEPTHRLPNPWGDPFFYADGRHVFYVTTTEQLVTVPQWNRYVVAVDTTTALSRIPQLVMPEVDIIPKRIDPVITGRPVADPAPMKRFVSEDAYIDKGIGISGTVRYGDVEIGPAGKRFSIKK